MKKLLLILTAAAAAIAQQRTNVITIIPITNPTTGAPSSAGEARFLDLGSHFVGLKGPASVSTDIVFQLPASDGSSGKCWGWSSAAVLDWVSCSGSLPIDDSLTIFSNHADPTKLLKVSLAALTTGTIRTLTVQDADYTIAGSNVDNQFSSAQHFQQSLLPTGTVNIGSTSAFFNNGFIVNLFAGDWTVVFGGANKAAIGWDNTNSAIAIVNNIAQTLFEFDVAGQNVSYFNFVPAATNAWDLGSIGLTWNNGYIKSLNSTTATSGTFTSVAGSQHIDLTAASIEGYNGSGVGSFVAFPTSSGGIIDVLDSSATIVATISYAGISISSAGTLTLSGVSGCLTASSGLVAGLGTPCGTVTSIATSGPISGGTFTTSGTISCPTCLTTSGGQTVSSSDTFTGGLTSAGNILASGTVNLGSSSTGFTQGFINSVFTQAITVTSSGSTKGILGYDSSNSAIAITNNISQELFRFDLAGQNVSYFKLIPSVTNSIDLGSSGLTWNNGFIKSLTSTAVTSGTFTSVAGSQHIDLTAASIEGYNGSGVASFLIFPFSSGGILDVFNSSGAVVDQIDSTGISIASGATLKLTGLSGCLTAVSGVVNGLGVSCGTGTVTSVATSGPINGGPFTTSGTISCPTCAIAPGAWTSYSPTPTYSAGTISVSSSDCAYSQNGKTVNVRIHLTFSVGTNGSNSFITIPLPVASASNGQNLTANLFLNGNYSFSDNATLATFNGNNVLATSSSSLGNQFSVGTTYDIVLSGIYQST